MEPANEIHTENEKVRSKLWLNVLVAGYLIGAIILFLFAITLMVHALGRLGGTLADTILQATSNPFSGLFIGLLVTALLQSSSASTSLVIAFVASGAITIAGAVPIVMGANIGTTITSTLVSLAFITRRKEFRRAVSAGTYHSFFNILTAVILFPLEYYYHLLSRSGQALATYFFLPQWAPLKNVSTSFSFGFNPVIHFMDRLIPSGAILAIVSIILLFLSIILFRRIVSNLLQTKRPEILTRFFFANQSKSFAWGMVLTAAIRSSTITTSMVVPLVAKKLVPMRQAIPFIIGANMGTTITAFIAVTLSSQTSDAATIAMVHLLFNVTGVMLFLITPLIKEIPVRLSDIIGELTLRYRLAGLVYILVTFFFVPFILIYLNRGSIEHLQLVYEVMDLQQARRKNVELKLNTRSGEGEWWEFHGEKEIDKSPQSILTISQKNKTLFIGQDMILFNGPGYCWDHEKGGAEYHTCVLEILAPFQLGNLKFDSVYRFKETRRQTADSAVHYFYYNANPKFLVLHEIDSGNQLQIAEKLIVMQRK